MPEEDDVLPYPEAGNGIQLPPEKENLSILLDDDMLTFSHTWQAIGEMMDRASSGIPAMTRVELNVGA